jgi:hypothetical protein
MNLEGIVSKRIDTIYRSGPFHGWKKIKNPGYVRPLSPSHWTTPGRTSNIIVLTDAGR